MEHRDESRLIPAHESGNVKPLNDKKMKMEKFLEDRLDETMLFFVRGGEDPPSQGGGGEPQPDPTWPEEVPPPPPGGGD